MLKIAIQKSGRLHKDSIEFLKKCGLGFSVYGNVLHFKVNNFDAEGLFLRDDDIPGYVEQGVADIGIAGLNVVNEHDFSGRVLKRLGFAKCRLSIAAARSSNIKSAGDLTGKKIATTYPVLLKKYLDENNISAQIVEISGSVEIAPGIGLADAICDLVSTGSTLLQNGLEEVETILSSEAVLVASKSLNSEKEALLEQLILRIESVINAKTYRYAMFNVPNDAIEQASKLLPGINGPTVFPLAGNNWSALHCLVKENDFWQVAEDLKKIGAEGIVLLPIG